MLAIELTLMRIPRAAVFAKHLAPAAALGHSLDSRDGMLAIELTLMRILRAAVFAKHLAPAADAVQSLIDDHTIAGLQVVDCVAGFFHDTRDLVTKDLRLQRERNRLSVIVC